MKSDNLFDKPFTSGRWLWFLILIFLTACGGGTASNPAKELPPLDVNFDLLELVLVPEDVSDLFEAASYSIRQPFESTGGRGLTVTYPTQSIQHTIAFAAGFATRLEIYPTNAEAAAAFETAVTQQTDTPLEIEPAGNASQAFVGKVITPEGAQLEANEYVVLLRQRNVLATLTLRTEDTVSAKRLSKLAKTIADRIKP